MGRKYFEVTNIKNDISERTENVMKKILCLILVLSSLLLSFSSCKRVHGLPDDLDYFTAVAKEDCKSNQVTVSVCSEYVDALGKTVTVKMKGLADLGIKKGDEIRVSVDSFKNGWRLVANASSVQVVSFEAPSSEYAEISAKDFGISVFTCTANGVSINRAISVKVDDEYREKLGNEINVYMEDIHKLGLGIMAKDKLRITVDIVKDTDPYTVYAKNIEILQKVGDEWDYGYGPYYIPKLSEIKISDDLTALTAETKLSSARDWDWYVHAFRVVKISDNIVYLAESGWKAAQYAIIGIPDYSFSVGDHVSIKVKKYYHDIISCDIAYAEDIESFEVLKGDDVYKAYRHSMALDKPVIYLYPEEETLCSVKVELNGRLTCTYPEHGESGWQNFTAQPDGTLVFPDGKEYYCLYWEGISNMAPDFSKGFCVKGKDTADFLSEILLDIGLTPREANEFIIYWLPLLQENEYNLISFQSNAYTDIAELLIDPAPDSLLRVYMVAKPLDNYIEIEPQTFDGFIRDGFTVVEWGGSILE